MRIRRCRSGPGGDRSRLGDSFFEDLAVGGLLVGKEESGVDGDVALSVRRVDLQLLEQRIHPECAAFVGDDRDDSGTERLVASQVAEQSGERHRRRECLSARTRVEFGERVRSRQLDRSTDSDSSFGDGTAEGLSALHQVLVLGGAHIRPVVRRFPVFGQHLVGDLFLQVEAVPQPDQLTAGELLDLMSRVAGLHGRTESPAFDRLGDDRRRAALMLDRCPVGRVDLVVVVSAAREFAQLIVTEMLDEFAQAQVGTEELVPDVLSGLDGVLLILPVEGAVHPVDEHAVDIPCEQLVPTGSPDHFDDVPAGASKHGFQFLNDLPVAPHRSIEALKIGVDDPREVVETFACRDAHSGKRFGLVHLPVAEERPDT
ncbi:hypothetical protein BMS3Bbin01_01485 [bacterium BMS3Bbin01]|nr:hypothetical protein BMS3Bbin01_01485 [bacterium BMS3Bbin01]